MIVNREATLRVATFTVGGARLGLPVEEIREVTKLLPVTPVPGAADEVKGVVNLRGEVVTVFALRQLLGLEPATQADESCLVFLKLGEETIVLTVEGVGDVVSVRTSDIEDSPANVADVERRFLRGVIQLEHDLLALLDVPAVLGSLAADAVCR